MKILALMFLTIALVACATPAGQPKPEVPQAEQKAPAKK